MIPKIIHQFWSDRERSLPDELVYYMDSVRYWHPEWEYKLWCELDGPVDKNCPAFQTTAGISNYVRLRALLLYGGVYLDTDCQCIRPLDGLLYHSAFAGKQDDVAGNGYADRLGTAVLGAMPDHPWIKWQLQHFDFQDGDPASSVYLASRAPREHVAVLPSDYFYPYRWDEKPRHPTRATYVVHHWTKLW
jgi:mannosyltransferase OCH1-like enzyme